MQEKRRSFHRFATITSANSKQVQDQRTILHKKQISIRDDLRAGKHQERIADRPKIRPVSEWPFRLFVTSHNIYYVKSSAPISDSRYTCYPFILCRLQNMSIPIVNNFSITSTEGNVFEHRPRKITSMRYRLEKEDVY